MINTIIFYAIISIVVIFMGHSIFKYFSDLYTDDITHDLHSQSKVIMKDISDDATKNNNEVVQTREIKKEKIVIEEKKDELEDYMNSLDDEQEKKDPTENLPDKLLEFNSDSMSNYADYN